MINKDISVLERNKKYLLTHELTFLHSYHSVRVDNGEDNDDHDHDNIDYIDISSKENILLIGFN